MAETGTEQEGGTAFQEYKLAIEVQMHFNDLLMRLRTFGMTGVAAIFGFAAAKVPAASLPVFPYSQPRAIALCGCLLLVALGGLDFLYFHRLLLGAVRRSLQIEQEHPTWGLTRSINKALSKYVPSRFVILSFYAIVLVGGLALTFLVLP